MKTRKDVNTYAHLIADEEGRPQLHTLASSAPKAWRRLWGRQLTKEEMKRLKKQGFRAQSVWIKSYP
jgi:hypothetical protein